MRVLLFGADGMLGHDLLAQAPPGFAIVPHTISTTDVTAEPQVAAAVRDARPDVVLNSTGYTDVEQAEAERALAFAVNETGPATIGRVVAGLRPQATVVHYGTDYVFDGRATRPYREDDAPQPRGVDGASKLAGERALAASGASHVIIRTQWLFGPAGRSFPRTMWNRARAGQPTRVVNDQTGRPTYTVDLARTTWRLLAGGPPRLAAAGLQHVTNAGSASWYDLARRIFEAAGAGAALSPCATADYPTPARRPAHSVLDTARFESLAGGPLPTWQDALDRFLNQLRDEEGMR
jgi:dTDP-4-dehydrorhamnose reductase